MQLIMQPMADFSAQGWHPFEMSPLYRFRDHMCPASDMEILSWLGRVV